MKQLIPFAKAEATGNDFILVNDRDLKLELVTPQFIRSWCDRHFGIGADGLIHLQLEKTSVPRMSYFNADGSPGEMCGNGLRAAALYLLTLGVCENKYENKIAADDGLHSFFFNEDGTITVELLVTEKKEIEPLPEQLHLPSGVDYLGFKWIGVPHLVLLSNQKEMAQFESWAKQLRAHPVFGKEGTNVNVLIPENKQTIFVRTYERGVEAETLSCGTGVTACALLYWQKISTDSDELSIQTQGGNLKVKRQAGRLFLTGAANMVFVGYRLEKFEKK